MLSFQYTLKDGDAVNSLFGYNTESIVGGANGTARIKAGYSCGVLSGKPSVIRERGSFFTVN